MLAEHTTFEDEIVKNEARLPSLTLCPDNNEYSNKSIESFEDVEEEIKSSKKGFKIKYHEYKPNGETNIFNETFNQTLNNDWYFAPRIKANETLICLIMSPFGDQQIPRNWSVGVSYCCNGNIFHKYINYILVSLATILV